ncbi:MAG: hypothetical protein WC477_01200 [Patescibacteria group bacterium]
MPKRFVIIGQGPAGKAVKHILDATKNHVSIECWDIDIKVCPNRKPLQTIVPKADIIFLCIPSWAIRAAAKDLGYLIKKQTGIVSVSKGLDRSTEATVDELIAEVFPRTKRIALLSGPMLAEEIMQNKPAAALIASPNKAFREELEKVFKQTRLQVETSSDVRGVALCGILKNIYAIGFGISQAQHPGDNFRGMFAYRCIEEMRRIVVSLGGEEDTVCSYAGISDLISTGFSKHSKNHTYGRALVESGKPDFDSEGSVSVGPLSKRIGKRMNQYPIFKMIDQIVARKKKVSDLMKLF